MAGINIRTDQFTKEDMKVIEECLKEWNWEDIVHIVYVGEGDKEKLDVSFTLDESDLGDFLSFIFSCGHESVFRN